MKDQMSLGMEPGGKSDYQWCHGYHRYTETVNLYYRCDSDPGYFIRSLNLINSRDGRAIMAIRDNRIAAESIGIDITKYKLKAFAISAALAGIGGVLYAHNLATLTALPKNFGYNMSIMFLVFVVLGGIGNMRGSIIAAVILNLLPELLRGLSDYRMLFYAIVLIVMMLINWAPKAIEMRERLFSKFKKKEA